MAKARTGSVFFEHTGECRDKYHRRCEGRWRGVATMDGGVRRKVSGTTRKEVVDKLGNLQEEAGKGIRPKAGYTVDQ